MFEPRHNFWKVAKANRTTFIVDAENYFRYVRRAMKKTENRIVLLGWDFDARFKMHDTQEEVSGPLVKLGATGLEISRLCLGCMTFEDSSRGAHAWLWTRSKAVY